MLSGRAARMVAFVYHALFKDIERWNGVKLSKSESVFFTRLDSEGFSFVTSTLPPLGKALDTVLAGGLWVRPPMFKAKSSTDVRPALFFELFELVLDEFGFELEKPSVTAVKDIRQISGLFYKYELPFDDGTIERAWQGLIETDTSLRRPILPKSIKGILDLACILLNELLCDVDPKSGIPNHGPGAVVESLPNWEKSLFEEIPTDKALQYYGFNHFLHTPLDAQRSMSKHGRKMHFKKQVKPVSVFGCVPKDSRGPRVVCKEHTVTQWLQQAAKSVLYDHIENHPLTSGKVNFTDQTINGRLALWGSHMERDIVTLDMKDASSRIAWWLVKYIFPSQWVEMLDATRSEYIQRSDRNSRYGPIRMYAPMGSALSFPIESLVHWSLAVSSITLVNGLDINDVLENVYVYGDDIVLRGLPYKSLFKIFSCLGMKFNEGKCCTGGRFRESCGTDAYRGELVSPLRIKKPILSSGDANVFVASVAYCNAAYEEGLHSLSDALREVTEECWDIKLPYVTGTSGCIGMSGGRGSGGTGLTPLKSLRNTRYNKDLHVIEHRGIGTSSVKFKGSTDWCRYRDTLRALASRPGHQDSARTFEPVPVPASEKAPTYRHSLFMTKIWSSDIVPS